MSKSKLVCNLSLDDFFTLPDSSETWRRCGSEPCWAVDTNHNNRRTKGYDCVTLSDANKKTWLPASQRVELVDK